MLEVLINMVNYRYVKVSLRNVNILPLGITKRTMNATKHLYKKDLMMDIVTIMM